MIRFGGKAFGELRRFRQEFHSCLISRADAMFELTDAALCADGPVRSLAELSLVGEHRRGHGSSYAAVVDGRIDVELDSPVILDGQPHRPRTRPPR